MAFVTHRPRFEEGDFDEAEYSPRFSRDSRHSLPPVEFKVEEIADSASPEEMIRAALEDRVVETALEADASFGPIVVPSEKSLYGYKYALSNGGHDIRFSHATYGIFDGVIVRECGVDEGGNPVHRAFNSRLEYYPHYAPLRRNIAILRNYLFGLYPPGKDKANQALLRIMAGELGKALAGAQSGNLTFIQRIAQAIRGFLGKDSSPSGSNHFLALANTPDRGIAFMYDYLCGQQAAFASAMPPSSPLPRNWKLNSLEETPFSASNIARDSDAARMGVIAGAFDLVARHLKSVEDMTPKDKEISVDHARDILKNLRILLTGVQEEKEYSELDPRCREAQSMLQSALCFQGALADMARDDPDVLNDPLIIEASKSIVKIASRVKQEEQVMQKQERRAETTTQPQAAQKSRSGRTKSEKQKSQESIQKLVFKFEEGINRTGELRKARREKSHGRTRDQSDLQKALSKNYAMPKALQEGQSTMSGPKIHQVSLSDIDFIETVKKLNEDVAVEQEKATPGGQSPGRK